MNMTKEYAGTDRMFRRRIAVPISWTIVRRSAATAASTGGSGPSTPGSGTSVPHGFKAGPTSAAGAASVPAPKTDIPKNAPTTTEPLTESAADDIRTDRADRMEAELERLWRSLKQGEVWLGSDCARLWRSPSNRRIDLLPLRNPTTALTAMARNMLVAGRQCCVAIPYCVARSRVKRKSVIVGIGQGMRIGLLYAVVGFVANPLIHLVFGVCNSTVGAMNCLTKRYSFNALRGNYSQHNLRQVNERVESAHHKLSMLNKVGHSKATPSWFHKLLYTKLPALKHFLPRNGEPTLDDDETHYAVLGVSAKASEAEIKRTYKELVKKLHPDSRAAAQGAASNRVGSRGARSSRSPTAGAADGDGKREGPGVDGQKEYELNQRFIRATEAYKVLANPVKRKTYDAKLDGSAYLSTTLEWDGEQHTPLEVMQQLFGGVPFQELIAGPFYRTRYHMKTQDNKQYTESEFWMLVSLELDRLALQLATLLDHWGPAPPAAAAASTAGTKKKGSRKKKGEDPQEPEATYTVQPLPRDVNDIVEHLRKASFGRELCFEVGFCYQSAAKEALGYSGLAGPQRQIAMRTFGTMGQNFAAAAKPSAKMSNQEQMINVALDKEWVDLTNYVFFVCYEVSKANLYDSSVTAAHRRVRAERLLALSERLIKVGKPWHGVSRDTRILSLQQALKSEWNTRLPLHWPTQYTGELKHHTAGDNTGVTSEGAQ